jgi:hypothetical protein
LFLVTNNLLIIILQQISLITLIYTLYDERISTTCLIVDEFVCIV